MSTDIPDVRLEHKGMACLVLEGTNEQIAYIPMHVSVPAVGAVIYLAEDNFTFSPGHHGYRVLGHTWSCQWQPPFLRGTEIDSPENLRALLFITVEQLSPAPPAQ